MSPEIIIRDQRQNHEMRALIDEVIWQMEPGTPLTDRERAVLQQMLARQREYAR